MYEVRVANCIVYYRVIQRALYASCVHFCNAFLFWNIIVVMKFIQNISDSTQLYYEALPLKKSVFIQSMSSSYPPI